MNFLKQLQNHKGGLIKLKTQLYWYGGRDTNSPPAWDKTPERICMLLDAAAAIDPQIVAGLATAAFRIAAATAVARSEAGVGAAVATHLLIDGQPHWIWVTEKDTELLNDIS